MRHKVLDHLMQRFRGYLDAPGTTEVVINTLPGRIGVEANGKWTWYESTFTFDELDALAIVAARLSSQDIGPEHPDVTTALPTGERLHICRPPITRAGTISLTFRKPPAFRPTIDYLERGGYFERFPELPDKLRFAVPNFWNILICGKTGCGKTTLARALIELIPLHERLISIEDADEWAAIPHENRVALFYSKGDQGTSRVQSEHLLESALRMRPDRILMAELRDGAAYSYLRSIVAGHPGCITTLHARSAEDAFSAVGLMVRKEDRDVMEATLRKQIDLVIYCEKITAANDNSIYRVTDLYEKPREALAA